MKLIEEQHLIERTKDDFRILVEASRIQHDPKRMENLDVEDTETLEKEKWIRSRPRRLEKVQNLAKEEQRRKEERRRERVREKALKKLSEIKKERGKVQADLPSPAIPPELDTSPKEAISIAELTEGEAIPKNDLKEEPLGSEPGSPSPLPETSEKENVESGPKTGEDTPERDDPFSKGAFLVSRSLFKSEVWFHNPLYVKAWIWMIGKANYQEVKEGDFIYHRGELYTTHEEIREVLKFYQNREKIIPTLKQVRAMLDWFVKAEMIEKRPVSVHPPNVSPILSPSFHHLSTQLPDLEVGQGQTTRAYLGLRIRLIKYDPYQSLINYRGRPQGHTPKNELGQDKGRTRAEQGQTPLRQPLTIKGSNSPNKEKKEKNKKTFVEDSDEFRLASFLFKEIKERKERLGLSPPKRPDLQAWAHHIESLIRIDGRTPHQIEQMILWTQHNEFWGKNICSTGKLREKFGRLEEDMVSEKKGKTPERPKEERTRLTRKSAPEKREGT